MQTTRFEAPVRFRDGIAIMDLRGDIDAGAGDGLDTAYGSVESRGARALLLNFGSVGYINSTGIALVVGLLARARRDHRPVQAFGLSDHYREIFQITRLSDFMAIFPDENAAVTSASA